MVGKIPWIRKWQCTPEFFPGLSHGQRTKEPGGYSPWDCSESDTTEYTCTGIRGKPGRGQGQVLGTGFSHVYHMKEEGNPETVAGT